MGNFKKSWEMEVGLNNVASYQVSGQPFVTGGIDCSAGPVKVEFPYVTRWVVIVNNQTAEDKDVKVGFSEAGVSANNYFTVPHQGGAPGLYASAGPLELKISEIWITGSNKVDIMAGLTSIPRGRTDTTLGPSWSGSSGVG